MELQKHNSLPADRPSGITLCHVRTSKDLINCDTITSQLKKHGEPAVKIEVATSLDKLVTSLSIDMSDNQFTILVEDIIEVYKYDSIEDIVECFKKVRQGKYDWGHEKRGVINMIVIGRWMAQHLEDKVVELEKSHEAIKKQSDYKLEQVDYEAYKQRQKEDKKKPDPTREETEYQKFKMEYLKNRKEPKL